MKDLKPFKLKRITLAPYGNAGVEVNWGYNGNIYTAHIPLYEFDDVSVNSYPFIEKVEKSIKENPEVLIKRSNAKNFLISIKDLEASPVNNSFKKAWLKSKEKSLAGLF